MVVLRVIVYVIIHEIIYVKEQNKKPIRFCEIRLTKRTAHNFS